MDGLEVSKDRTQTSKVTDVGGDKIVPIVGQSRTRFDLPDDESLVGKHPLISVIFLQINVVDIMMQAINIVPLSCVAHKTVSRSHRFANLLSSIYSDSTICLQS